MLENFQKIFSFDIFIGVITDYWYLYQDGIIYTLSIALGTIIIGCLIAMIMTPLRMSKNPILRFIASAYIEVVRSTPLLVQLFIVYYGLSPLYSVFVPKMMIFGFINTERFVPCIMAIGFNSGAYITEIIRSGISAVDGGQSEAARSLGMTKIQTMRYVILPQAIKNILPALGNEFVTVVKESSVCMFISIHDIMYVANDVQTRIYSTMEPLVVAAIIYFCIAFPLSKIIAYFERRMSRGDKR